MIMREVARSIKGAVKDSFDIDLEPEIVYAEAKFGDFATNVAFSLAKKLKRPPIEVAEALSGAVSHQDIAKTEAVAPGFINITMTERFWLKQLGKVDENYLNSTQGKGQKVQVEFISANPTGPLTLGNARGGFIGDVLSNVLEASGYEVTREYYFNDAGTQIAKLLESVKVEAGLLQAEDRQYSGVYIKQLADKYRDQLGDLEDKELRKLLTEAIFERYIKPDIDKMGIDFDVWFNETTLLEDGTFEKTVKMLEEEGLLFERDGATWVKTARGGDPREERVFIKSNGDPAYFAPDVAYHVNIFKDRGFDMAIKELGPDHIAQFPSVKAVVNVLFPGKELKMVGHQQLRLIKDGKEFKMSKRSGQYVTVGELIDEVGADIARFFFLMRSSDTHMDFDLDLAQEQSQKNPFWYVMYAYVRANAILNQAKERNLTPGDTIEALAPAEMALVKQLSRLPELVAHISSSYEVHKLTFYGQETARLFHDWYESVRVIDLPPEQAAQKLYLVDKFKTVMEAYFKLLGVAPYEQM